jgi:hypothetical protein
VNACVRERERYKQTDRQADRRRYKQSLAYLSQLLHLVGVVSESKVVEEEEERDRDRDRHTHTHTHTHTHRNTQTNLSQLLHLVGADVRAVSESKIEEEEERE